MPLYTYHLPDKDEATGLRPSVQVEAESEAIARRKLGLPATARPAITDETAKRVSRETKEKKR